MQTMRMERDYSLKAHNTFGLEVRARRFAEYSQEAELHSLLRDACRNDGKLLHIGAGSNLLFLNDYYDGMVLHSAIRGIAVEEETDEEVLLRVGAGETWDNVVAAAVDNGWYGIENLSLVPGESGAAAIQNIGAYGAEIKDVVEAVETCHCPSLEKRVFTRKDCRYAYRYSRFKDAQAEPCIVTHIRLRLSKRPRFVLHYGNLEKEVCSRYGAISLTSVRATVIALRKERLPDPATLGNAGSFFINPTVASTDFAALRAKYPNMPFYPLADNGVKIPAGWLIEQCGFKGQSFGRVGVYDQQALILTNLGGASGSDIAAVAETIRAAVIERFGITLTAEVQYVA